MFASRRGTVEWEFLLLIGVLTFGLAAPLYKPLIELWAPTHQVESGIQHFYDIVEKDAEGNDVSFSKFKGKVIYGVNIASLCGLTEDGFKLINKVAKIEGVEVLLFPCNQFMGQMPGSSIEAANFCMKKGAKGTHVFAIADVNGANTRPTYKFLKEKAILNNVMVREPIP